MAFCRATFIASRCSLHATVFFCFSEISRLVFFIVTFPQILRLRWRCQRWSRTKFRPSSRIRPCGANALSRLIRRYRQEQRTSALIPEKPGRKPGRRILGIKRDELIDAAINDFYLRPERPTLAAVEKQRILRLALHKINNLRGVWCRVFETACARFLRLITI